MYFKNILSALFVSATLSGCGSVSSSSAPTVDNSERITGPVYLTTASVPKSIGYEIVGNVKANARAGYDSVESLYPLLIDETKKIGANAVINVKGGRTVSAFSWAAPFTSGTAIKIDDLEKLKVYNGKYY